jgi:predicted HAD superfamily Cof-like phosphohydrolase
MEILCELCQKNMTPMLGTRRCDSCWELENRILANPALALQVLHKIGKLPQSNFSDVLAFHKKFGQLPEDRPPRLLSTELEDFRTKFMQEELNEYIGASLEGNLVGVTDALLDLVYVALGTAVLMGIPWQACWRHVQAANMRKVRAASAADSKRGWAHDVVKPLGWTGPEVGLKKELGL